MNNSSSPDDFPENPIVARVSRRAVTESVHRGAWCLVDTSGTVLEGAGNWDAPYYVRSAVKSIQALPLVESGAAERFLFSDEDVALALASHSGEACHTERVSATLARLGLDESALLCGTHPPNDPAVRRALSSTGSEPSALHNNCSGKHAGFLALAKQLDVPLARYLDPESAGQELVRAALAELTETDPAELVPGVDGCSAPTYRVPLRGLALGFARMTNPDGLGSERRQICTRMVAAAGRNPELVGGSHKRIDTDILRVSGGRLFPKIGAEAIHAVGVRGGERALALKIDDGGWRGLHVLLLGLIEHLGLAEAAELAALESWRDPVLRNHAGLEVGRIESVLS